MPLSVSDAGTMSRVPNWGTLSYRNPDGSYQWSISLNPGEKKHLPTVTLIGNKNRLFSIYVLTALGNVCKLLPTHYQDGAVAERLKALLC